MQAVIRSDEIDSGFRRQIEALGGESVRKCYQCASCTATCPLTSEVKAFPRRTIRLVQLGLSEKAMQSPDMWLCSACATCKASCPRQADPGEIMAALRRYAYAKYSWVPKFTLNLTSSLKFTVPLMAVVGAILLALIYLASGISKGPIGVDFAAFLPTILVDATGIALGATVAFGIGKNSLNLWRMIGRGSDDPPQWTISQRLSKFMDVVIGEVALQRTLRKCNTGRLQWIGHLSLITGFAGAAITTSLVFILNTGGKPFPLDNPIKILGNASAALLIFGAAVLTARRIFAKNAVDKTHFQDAVFLTLLFIVALTGISSEMARLLGGAVVAYSSYSIHLVSAAFLLGLAPYTKFAHAVYRPMAMYIAKLRGWPD